MVEKARMSSNRMNQGSPHFRRAAVSSHRLVMLPCLLVIVAHWHCAERVLAQQSPVNDDNAAQQLYIKGRDLLRSNQEEQGLMCLRQAASNGLARAQYDLAAISLDPKAKGSRVEGLRWCLEASRQKMPEARLLLVDTLREDDPRKYLDEARPWLLSLAEMGEKHFQFKAALWLFYGIGGSRDYKEAFVWIAKAADSEAPSAVVPGVIYFQGYLYENGLGNAQDYPAAARAYWLAASHGEVNAAFRLGLLLDHGQGLPEDAESARELCRQAANLGLDRAQFQLARMLSNGRGGVTNLAEAFAWLMKSARQGFSPAQTQLGITCERGLLGQERDPAEAIAWYGLAARAGHRAARIRANNLEDSLSAAARAAAEKRSRELANSNIRPPSAGPRLVSTNLLPERLKENLPTVSSTSTESGGRPRTVFEARLRQTTGITSDFLRDDLHAGKLQYYCEELQKVVWDSAVQTLTTLYERPGGSRQPLPDRLEIILSFRLSSDGHIDDVDIVETNVDDLTAGAFVAALFKVSPLPKWIPSLRAEMSDDYQDLLMAFGRQSQMKIQRQEP
jgi:uncharacterized protein